MIECPQESIHVDTQTDGDKQTVRQKGTERERDRKTSFRSIQCISKVNRHSQPSIIGYLLIKCGILINEAG